jgi:hypothetical protein
MGTENYFLIIEAVGYSNFRINHFIKPLISINSTNDLVSGRLSGFLFNNFLIVFLINDDTVDGIRVRSGSLSLIAIAIVKAFSYG